MRVLYVEAAYGFGGSLTGLLHLFRTMPSDIVPMLVTCFDPHRYVEVPEDLQIRQVAIRRQPPTPPNRLRSIANYYRYVIAAWYAELDPIIRDFQPDVIHANNSLVSNFGVGIAARKHRVRAISHQKGFEHTGRFSRFLIKHNRFDHHIATSGAVATHLESLGLPPARCSTVYEPVIGPREDKCARPDQRSVPIVAMHSMLVPEKGQHVVLRAAAELVRRGVPPFRLVVAGTSPAGETEYLDSLNQLAAELGIQESVEFRGHLRDVYEFLSGVDVAVHAAVEPEPFGRVVAEAMFCGLPSIVTADGGPAEYVEEGVTGFCVPRGDIGAMANALEPLIRSASLRRQVGDAARQFAVRAFEPFALSRQVVDIYERVLQAVPRRDSGSTRQFAATTSVVPDVIR